MEHWDESIQSMLDWLEEHLAEAPSLLTMSAQIGYSPAYCSTRFHKVTGITLKRYLAGRRLSRAAIQLRDTDKRILDIALDCGFSSQQALSKAFVFAFRCTPAAYRSRPVPVPLPPKKNVLFPAEQEQKGAYSMNQTLLTDPIVRVEFIPAHKYICIRDKAVQAYFPFWEHGHSCDEICGTIDSMSHTAHPILPAHTAGWFWEEHNRGYSYGFGVPADYSGPIPEGFEVFSYPDSYYLVFSHPRFDFQKDCAEVYDRVENLAWNFDPKTLGFAWNEFQCQDYQRMMPEVFGYEVLRPVTKL